MSHYIDNILEKSEHKKWEGKINRKVIVTVLIIWLVIIIGVSSFFFAKETINYTSNGTAKQISGFFTGIVILCVGLFLVLWNFFSNIVVEYAITNKRVVIKSGIIGTDYKSI